MESKVDSKGAIDERTTLSLGLVREIVSEMPTQHLETVRWFFDEEPLSYEVFRLERERVKERQKRKKQKTEKSK